MKRSILEGVFILCVAMAVALAVNGMRPDGVRLYNKENSHQKRKVVKSISPGDAMEFFGDDVTLFLDARTPELYRRGHLKGAINMPRAGDVDLADFTKSVSFGKRIITYSAGEEENLAEKLGESLFYAGYGNVFYVKEAWDGWASPQPLTINH